jgi:hypothetical protein
MITHLAPASLVPSVKHTTQPLYLIFDEFERYLGSPFPLRWVLSSGLLVSPSPCLLVLALDCRSRRGIVTAVLDS